MISKCAHDPLGQHPDKTCDCHLWSSGIPERYKEKQAEANTRMRSALDSQVGGLHYASLQIQPVEFIHRNGIGYLEGNVIKYISRHKQKNGKEDIKKAIHYCELILEMEYTDCEKS